jgi:hypothetical protein
MILEMAYSFFNRAIAGFIGWRLLKKSLHGSFFLSRSPKLPMLKVEGSSEGLTSDQASGVETGACGFRRTE